MVPPELRMSYKILKMRNDSTRDGTTKDILK